VVHQEIDGLDILVNEAALVELAHRYSDADRKMQKASHIHRRGRPQVERIVPGILKQQCDPTAFADELKRSCCPGPVQVVLQSIFVSEAIEGGRSRMLGRERDR
jgi:hypothetical protein